MMRAVVHDAYGSPEVLRLEDVAAPVPRAGEVLVEVHATTVNRTDCGFRQGKPFFVRLFSGLVRPKYRTLGTEFAGVVIQVGPGVGRFTVGDRVFGVNADRFGAHAELLRVAEASPVARMPAGAELRRGGGGVRRGRAGTHLPHQDSRGARHEAAHLRRDWGDRLGRRTARGAPSRPTSLRCARRRTSNWCGPLVPSG